MLMQRLKHALLVVLLFEILIFIAVAYFIGILYTIGIIVVISLFGFVLLKINQHRMMKQMNSINMQNPLFMLQMMQSSYMSFSAILLIIPGFLTDLVGIGLLIPKTRGFLMKFGQKILKLQMPFPTNMNMGMNMNKNDSDIIDGEYSKHDEDIKKIDQH